MNQAAIQRSCFVTGAAGCIGSALTRRLACSGFRVVAMVRDQRSADHIARLPGVELLECELSNRQRMSEAMRGCDLVFHGAARVHAAPGTPPEEFMRDNVEGTLNVVEAAIETRASSLVFFSTVAVYPESDEVFDEQSATAPATAYGASKLAAEQLVLELGARHNLRATVLRLPVVYGPRDRGNVARLIEAVRHGRYFIVGDGRNTKSMVAVGNVIDAALLVADDPRAAGQVYIVSDARNYSQRELAETIAELCGRTLPARNLPRQAMLFAGHLADGVQRLTGRALPLSADRVRKLTANTAFRAAKIERELGFTPRIALREGLRAAMEPS